MSYPKGGHQQRILRVDLSKREISDESPPRGLLHQYIGGTGLGIRLLYDEVKPGIDPYSPENRVIFATGPLTGTLVPGSGTYSVVSRNTLTGLAAAAQANGFFGARLKYAGFDAVIVQGRSEKPVYVHVNDGVATIEDASDLKGKDTFEVDRSLRQRLGEKGIDDRLSVAAIGPAGENLVRFACIVSDRGHIAASGGLGAIMGSKNVKALVVHGSRGVPIDPVDTRLFLKCVYQWRVEALKSRGASIDRDGTIGLFIPYHSRGWVPVKNLTTNVFPKEERFSG